MEEIRVNRKVALYGLLVATVCCPCFAQQVPGTLGPVASKLQFLVDQHMVSGFVTLVAGRDKVLDVEAYGMADIATGRPMKAETEFWIASQSKAITACALMMLVDEGKVKLDDPVEKYLPEFKGQKVLRAQVQGSSVARPDQDAASNARSASAGSLEPESHPITIREAMSHSAGLPFKSSKETGVLDTAPLKVAVAGYAADPLIFQPGTDFKYANEGINTAGRIVEVVSGMPYETFLQTRIFDPLGMKDTTFWPSSEQVSRLAKSYKSDGHGGLVEENIDQLTYPLSEHKARYPMPAGGLFSTAADLARFCQMLLNGGTFQGHTLLSPQAVATMSSKQTPEAVKNKYGFGLYVAPDGFGHGGAYKTTMDIDTKDGFVTLFMVQKIGPWTSPEPQNYQKLFKQEAQKIAAFSRSN